MNKVNRTSLVFVKDLCEVLKVYTFDGPVAQLVRAPPCHGGGHGFESRLGRLVFEVSHDVSMKPVAVLL